MSDTIHSFKDQGRNVRDIVFHTVIELNNVGSSVKGLKNFDFPSYFLHLDWFQNFDDALLIVDIVYSIVNFRVLASPKLLDNFVGLHAGPSDIKIRIVVIALWFISTCCWIVSW